MTRTRNAELHSESTFGVPDAGRKPKRILLLSPPVYDAQYWARWSQPAGLLRIASLLKLKGHKVDLVDCMETDANGLVPKSARRDQDDKPVVIERDDIKRKIWHYGLKWPEVEQRMLALEDPDEVWIGSIMTYWWESTRDAVELARRIWPKALILVGGIYPTLAPDHALERLGADIVFKGELSEASHQWTDLSLYKTPPTYAILTTSRGCPWDCHYCAARALNNNSAKMRARAADDVLAEIEDKKKRHGIRHFGFYEDNALVMQGHLKSILDLIIERGHKLELYAPEGFETRFLTEDLCRTMKRAGFRKIHLPFEALKLETNLGWNRRHASTASFDRALDAVQAAGFRARTEDINAFILFGLPDDSLPDIMDSVLYVHNVVGSIIPMLFTPVPGTHVFNDHQDYLQRQMTWDLHQLNGKLLPFLEHNRIRYPDLKASDYVKLEALMSILNQGKSLSKSMNLCADNRPGNAFRRAVLDTMPDQLPALRLVD